MSEQNFLLQTTECRWGFSPEVPLHGDPFTHLLLANREWLLLMRLGEHCGERQGFKKQWLGQFHFSFFSSGYENSGIPPDWGCFQFLACWFWEYANVGRPTISEINPVCFPRASRWARATANPSSISSHRASLDKLSASNIMWRPYNISDCPEQYPFKQAEEFLKSRCYFVRFSTWEAFLGERCAKQLSSSFLAHEPPPKIFSVS